MTQWVRWSIQFVVFFIDTGLYVMLLMRANSLLGQVGGGWALEILSFLGRKWHSPTSCRPAIREFHFCFSALVPASLSASSVQFSAETCDIVSRWHGLTEIVYFLAMPCRKTIFYFQPFELKMSVGTWQLLSWAAILFGKQPNYWWGQLLAVLQFIYWGMGG